MDDNQILSKFRSYLSTKKLFYFHKYILLEKFKDVTDETTKILIKNQLGRHIAFAIISPESNPEIIKKGNKQVELIKNIVSQKLSNTIVEPLYEGNIDGLSFAIWPYYQKLSNNRLLWHYQRKILTNKISSWLLDIANETSVTASYEQIGSKFVDPLIYLSKIVQNNTFFQRIAHESLECFEDKDWRPINIVAHNDLWKGNILLEKSFPYISGRFIVIDWSGSQVHGYPIYDLVRFAHSFKLSTCQFRQQLLNHCNILNCNIFQSRCYLVCSLASLSMNIDNFPLHRFIKLAESCLGYFNNAVNEIEKY
jgi:thiamine kinase-like enzyme